VSDRAFLASFEAASLEEFHHRDHVRAAWCYLGELPLLEALERFTTSLKRFASAKGQPQLYHETITWAYVFLIHERMQDGESWDAFADRNADLFSWRPSILDRLYRPETIQSERARRSFVLPDASRSAI
jgi:hypothetical protein